MSSSLTTDSHAMSLRQLWLADLLLLSAAVIWGVNIPVMKVALELGISPYALNAVRLVISSIVLLTCAVWQYRSGVRPTASLSWGRVFLYAIVVSVAYQFLFLMAVSRTTSANVALIMATVPMWTALGARFFLKETLPAIAWLGLLIAFTGTMIVTVQRDVIATRASENESPVKAANPATSNLASNANVISSESAESFAKRSSRKFVGNLIALLAALTWAGGTVYSRPLLKTISPLQLAACSATIGLPFHLIIAGPTLAASLPLLTQVPLQLCILYSGILSTGLALAMWSYGVKHAGAAQAAMFQNLSPIVAIAAAWAWRGEVVSGIQALGGAMIIGGLIIMRQSRKP